MEYGSDQSKLINIRCNFYDLNQPEKCFNYLYESITKNKTNARHRNKVEMNKCGPLQFGV